MKQTNATENLTPLTKETIICARENEHTNLEAFLSISSIDKSQLFVIPYVQFRFILESQVVECLMGSYYTQRF